MEISVTAATKGEELRIPIDNLSDPADALMDTSQDEMQKDSPKSQSTDATPKPREQNAKLKHLWAFIATLSKCHIRY